jgi:hypothetical protein
MILRELRQALAGGVTGIVLLTGIFLRGEPAVMSDGALSVVKASFIRCSQLDAGRDEGPLFVR